MFGGAWWLFDFIKIKQQIRIGNILLEQHNQYGNVLGAGLWV
jgi:hypothetical protein